MIRVREMIHDGPDRARSKPWRMCPHSPNSYGESAFFPLQGRGWLQMASRGPSRPENR